MKIFDFSNGQIGEILDNVRVSYTKSNVSVEDPVTKEIKFLKIIEKNCFGKNSSARVVTEAGDFYKGKLVKYRPENYGVEAIAICLGLWTAGEDSEWMWVIVGTDAWIAKSPLITY